MVPVMSPTKARSAVSAAAIVNDERIKARLSVKALADACGIPNSTLHTKIMHIDRFTFGELKLLCLALDVELLDLLERAA